MLDAYKELVPVLYGENGVKILTCTSETRAVCFTTHWHDRIELLQIHSGLLEVSINNEHITALPGQTVVIMPHMIHSGVSGEEGVSYHVVSFDPEAFCNRTVASNKYLLPLLEQKVLFSHVVEHPRINSTITELIAYCTMSSELHPLCTIGKIYELLGLLCRHCAMESKHCRKTDSRFDMILDHINNHYTEAISAKSISRKFGYDEAYFCRHFKERTGITTMKYIKILRLELAQKLLQEKKDDIRSISLQCGFSDISYFSNCFKQHFGLTPTELRNKSTAPSLIS